jgi:competence protein ComFC
VNKSFNAIDFIADLIAPNRCPFCGEFIVWNSFGCETCVSEESRLPFRELPNTVDRVFAAFVYEGKTEKAVYALKYKHNAALAGLSAEVIVNSPEFNAAGFDLLVPVPMHKTKLYSRYYNPAEVLANRIKRLTGIAVINNALSHVKTDKIQHHLTERERFENAAKVYSVLNADETVGKRILLCDDVLTTGATIGVCAELLIKSGAKSVSAAVCAATKRTDQTTD